MEQITVPQFISNEDKIMGPLTVRQFLIILLTSGILYLVYKYSDFSFFLIMFILMGGSASVLAFYRVNTQPFHFFLLHVFQTMKVPSLRIWKKEIVATKELVDKSIKHETPIVMREHPQLDNQRLSEIALVVDTGGAYHGEKDEGTELF